MSRRKSYLGGLLGGNERMRDGVNGEGNSILHANLAHEFGNVGLDGAFLNAEYRANLFVGAADDQHLQNLFFTIRERHTASGKHSSRTGGDTFDKQG